VLRKLADPNNVTSQICDNASSEVTIMRPIGQSEMPISFRCAQAKGRPMIVMPSMIAVTRWASASHQPARTSQITLPRKPKGPVPELRPRGEPPPTPPRTPKGKKVKEQNVNRRPRPGRADDRPRHQPRRDDPGDEHPEPAGQDPEKIEEEAEDGHSDTTS